MIFQFRLFFFFEFFLLVALQTKVLGEAHAVFVNALGSTVRSTVMVIAVIAHAFGVEFLVDVWTPVDQVLFAIFNLWSLWFLGTLVLRALGVYHGVGGVVRFHRFCHVCVSTHVFAGWKSLLTDLVAHLRIEVRKLLSYVWNILQEHLQNIFLNLFFSGTLVFSFDLGFQIL